MKMKTRLLLLSLLLSAASASAQIKVEPPVSDAQRDIALLGDMELGKIRNGWGTIRKDRSIDGNRLTLNDTVYTSGVGAHAYSRIIVKLNGAIRFVSRLGIDDEVREGALADPTGFGVANYRVLLKGETGEAKVMQAGMVRYGGNSVGVDINTNGWKYLILETTAGAGENAGDHTDWVNAYFEYYARASTPPLLVSEEEIASKLACATTVFSQPGVRFMQKLRPTNPDATLRVENLPDGLTYNATRRLVEGKISTEGVYRYDVFVTHDGETAKETVTLTVSSSLDQPTPFMGWLSWNVFEHEINDAKVRQTADAFIKYGLLDAGYRYLCIDDVWHGKHRAADGAPTFDTTKFPHGFNALADYVHSKGLKFGIYSDAGTKTCAGEFGSVGYETQDATAYARWGFDLLKYDYCFAPDDVDTARKRYKAMGDALKATGRPILFYMCEWGPREPWKWGAETGATCWRVTYDSRDFWDWGARTDASHIGAIQGLDGTKNLWAYGGVNRWNDADMMCVGLHGKGKSSSYDAANYPVQPYTGMTQTEYQSQFSLWSIMASPLTLSFDLRTISDEDLAIITNKEVIAVNQDPMGVQGELIQSDRNFDVFVKDLENGDMAVAVLNRSNWTKRYTLDFAKAYLDPTASYILRDLWKKENVDTTKASYTMQLASHETKIFRITPADNATGLKRIAAPMEPPRATFSDSCVKVVCKGSEGISKRILVSDLSGRVVAEGTTAKKQISMPCSAPRGSYIVTVVARGVSQSVKVQK